MMCIEVRIHCTQPPSRGFSGSLPTLTKVSRRSPELRHQLAVFLSDLTPESASQRKNAASLPVYPFWAFSGVTLAEMQMVVTVPASHVDHIGPHRGEWFHAIREHTKPVSSSPQRSQVSREMRQCV